MVKVTPGFSIFWALGIGIPWKCAVLSLVCRGWLGKVTGCPIQQGNVVETFLANANAGASSTLQRARPFPLACHLTSIYIFFLLFLN
jgi:hypothetical protein